MLEAQENIERTILDHLNEDCWRAVLQYVPVQDLIQTECASRHWQRVVLTYLQGIHISIDSKDEKNKRGKNVINTCTLNPPKYNSFETWTKKLGPSVASTYCNNIKHMAMFKENCPNLVALQLFHIGNISSTELQEHNLQAYNFKLLQQVSFYRCSMEDGNVTKFLADKALEEIEFRYCRNLTGVCFKRMNVSNLKYLGIETCKNLEFLEFVDCLGELLGLRLANCNKEIGYDVQFVLEKMPKLERLELRGGYMLHGFSEKVGQLSRLQHLSVTFELDRWNIETVMQNCRGIRSLELLQCQYMSGVVEVISRYGAGLTSLVMAQFVDATDDDLLLLLRSCADLKSLTVTGTSRLTRTLPARAHAARCEARFNHLLRLNLSDTNLDQKSGKSKPSEQLEEMKTKFNNIIVDFEKRIDEYDEYEYIQYEDSDECMEWYEEYCEEELDDEWEDVDEFDVDGVEFEEDEDELESD